VSTPSANHLVKKRPALASPRIRRLLFAGLLLLFLSVWKGDGGYVDLGEYLDDAERLWLKGDMRLPSDPQDVEDLKELRAIGEISDQELDELIREAEAPRYNRYAIGLPLLSGPLIGLGAGLEKITGGLISPRGTAALTVPLLSVLACVLLYDIGLLFGIPASAALWAAIVYALGSPLLAYSRLFFTESALVFCILLAVWAHLKSKQASALQEIPGWHLLTGIALALLTACHYGSVFISAALGITMGLAALFKKDRPWRDRTLAVAALLAAPLLTAAGILLLNRARYGSPFKTGGYDYDVEHQISFFYFSYNLRYLVMWLLRNPWLPAAFFFGLNIFRRDRFLGAGIFLAAALQSIFWLCYQFLGYFPYRYPQSITALCAVGLLFLAAALPRPWMRGGLAAVLITANICLMLAGDSTLLEWKKNATASEEKFIFRGDDTQSRPFRWINTATPETPKWDLHCLVWYMRPLPKDAVATTTPMGWLQWGVLFALLSGGAQLLALAAIRAAKLRLVSLSRKHALHLQLDSRI
jgi:hypothetical protein